MIHSLRFRMLALITFLAILPQVFLVTIVGRQSRQALEQQALIFQERVAVSVSDNVAGYVQEHLNELRLLDQIDSLGTLDLKAQNTILKNLLHTQRVFHELILLDQNGQEKIYLSRTDVILEKDLSNRASRPEFRIPLTSRQPYFGPVIFDNNIREPLMLLAIPLFDPRQGDVVAVLQGNLRFKPVWNLLAGLELPGQGDAYVVNQAGRIVAHRNPQIVLSGRTIDMSNGNGRGSGLMDNPVFFATHSLNFGDQELLIIAEQPVSTALQLANTITRLSLITLILSLLAAISLVILANRQIVLPVENLASAARTMIQNNFSKNIELQGKDEIRELSRAFNTMQAELRSLVTSLEDEIIQRTRVEQSLQKANERLVESDRVKSKFIADISHELRTPITSIKLYLELLERGKPESRAKYESILKKESDRLAGLLDDILNFSTRQANLKKAAFAPVAFNSLVAGAVDEFAQPAHARSLDLIFVPADNPLHIWGNAEQLTQILDNLLQNAMNYTPAGFIKITTALTSGNEMVQLTVEDSGIGMDAEELEHCFDRLYRGNRVGQRNFAPGVGLGLTEVKEIVDFHGGQIKIESEVDQGTVVSISLPAHPHEHGVTIDPLGHVARI